MTCSQMRSAAGVAALFLMPLSYILAAENTGKVDRSISSAGRLARERIKQLNQGITIASPTGSCFNEPDCPEALLEASDTQSETTIAVDSTGKHVVVGFNDFRGFSNAVVSLSGYMYSDDGGKTFTDGGQLPSPGTDNIGGQLFPQIFGDPDVKYVEGCTFIYTSLALRSFGKTGIVQSLVFHRSTDCGHTWQGPFDIPPSINPNEQVDINGNAVDAADKELTDIDHDTGRYIVCWTNFTPVAVGFVEISCTYSDNILTPKPTFSRRTVVAARPQDGQGSAVRFAGNRSRMAIVAWTTFTSAYTNNVSYAVSTDNGQTWGPARELTGDFTTMDQVLGNDRVNTNPSLSIDTSSGPYKNSTYIVYSNNNSLDGADVLFQRSRDGGRTFSQPIALNRSPGRDRAQWFPYVTVDKTTGRVHVFYYDQGVDASGDLTQVSYTYSDNGGASWSDPRPLTERPFKAGWGNTTGQPNLGDYIQAVAQSGTFYSAYAVTHQIGFTDGQPGLGMTVPDVEVRVLTTADAVSQPASPPPPHPVTVAAGEPAGSILLSENFDSVPSGTLPPGWVAAHGAGPNIVRWTTSRSPVPTGCGDSNKAFHPEANDSPTRDQSRWERLFSPIIRVPAASNYVAVDFDVCYDTEDDPLLRIQAYDGFFLRVTDLTPERTPRSVLAEAFEQVFTTDDFKHYPKHFPRNANPSYFDDMSAWAGFSKGRQHVRLRFPGMAGSVFQLRFEYAQDFAGLCSDLRAGHTCGVSLDNVVVRNVGP